MREEKVTFRGFFTQKLGFFAQNSIILRKTLRFFSKNSKIFAKTQGISAKTQFTGKFIPLSCHRKCKTTSLVYVLEWFRYFLGKYFLYISNSAVVVKQACEFSSRAGSCRSTREPPWALTGALLSCLTPPLRRQLPPTQRRPDCPPLSRIKTGWQQ